MRSPQPTTRAARRARALKPKPVAQRPERPCLTCRKRTVAIDQVCRACKAGTVGANAPIDPEAALEGGRWVYVKGIARWFPDEDQDQGAA